MSIRKYERGSNWISRNRLHKIRITNTKRQPPINWLKIEYYDLRGDRRSISEISPLGFDQSFRENP